MTKQQLIDTVSRTSERSKSDVEAVIDSLLTEIGNALRAGEKVDLRGFGSFTAKERKARQGRNPRTGETIEIAAKKTTTFKPGKELADLVAEPVAVS